MIIICAALFLVAAAFALWQTWSLRGARAVGAHLLVELAKRDRKLARQRELNLDMLEVIGRLHQAAVSGDGAAILAVLQAANAKLTGSAS